MKRELAFTVILLIAVVAFAQGQALLSGAISRASQQDIRLSSVYASQAMTAIHEKDWPTAEGLIGVALQFNPANSDALFERGLLLEQRSGGIEGAIKAYTDALDAAHWSAEEPDTCRLRLAELDYRTKRYAEAGAQLAKMGAVDSAERSYLTARSLIGEGQTALGAGLLGQGIRVYPDDFRFVIERVRVDPAYRSRLAQRFLSGTDIASFPSDVLKEIIVDTPQAKEKQELIDRYDRLFPPSVTVLAESLISAAKVSDSEIERFVAAGGLKNGGLAEQLYASLKSPASRAFLAASAESFTGTSSWDTNRDGFAEREALYASGRLVRFIVDDRQDGLPSFDVRFEGSVPKSVVVNRDGVEYHIAYGEYPYVQSADFTEGDLKTTYRMEPSSLALPLFEPNTRAVGQLSVATSAQSPSGDPGTQAGRTARRPESDAGAKLKPPAGPAALPTSLLFPRLAVPAPVVTRDLLFASAHTVEEDNLALKRPVTLFRLAIGDVLKMESDWRKGTYRYLVEYRGKEKVLARRDIADDGRFDVTEYYKAGKLARLTYDPKHDGKPLFWIDYGSYPTLYWDYNGDGVPDAVEKQISPTRTLVEISTKLNGVFDVRTEEVTK